MPPSATYKLPSGPNFRPRGLLSPLAKTEIVCASMAGASAKVTALKSRQSSARPGSELHGRCSKDQVDPGESYRSTGRRPQYRAGHTTIIPKSRCKRLIPGGFRPIGLDRTNRKDQNSANFPAVARLCSPESHDSTDFNRWSRTLWPVRSEPAFGRSAQVRPPHKDGRAAFENSGASHGAPRGTGHPGRAAQPTLVGGYLRRFRP